MGPAYALIGGVDVSYACLEALCQEGHIPAIAVGYDESRAGASGYRDLRPLGQRYGFPVIRTSAVNDDDAVACRLAATSPALILVIGWSQLIKRPILELPARGCVGIHPTPLPLGRGRAPIPWTIIKQLRHTASTMFFLTEGVDDGDIIDAVQMEVDPRERADTLYAKHRAAHVELVRRHLGGLLDGTTPRHPQDHEQATYWPARSPEEGRIDPTLAAADIDRLIRAVTRPFPGAFLQDGQKRLRVWEAEPAGSIRGAPAGTLVHHNGDTLLACGEGALRLLNVEPE